MQLKRLDPAIKYRKSATRPLPDHQGEPFPIKRYRRFHPLERSIAAVLVNRCSHLGRLLDKKDETAHANIPKADLQRLQNKPELFPATSCQPPKNFPVVVLERLLTRIGKLPQFPMHPNVAQLNDGWVPLDCSPAGCSFFHHFLLLYRNHKIGSGVRQRSFP